ncbi:MAG: Protease HtpX [Candidatus Heimdallarchaeota archaeon LC_2]|nr:MAG: Protease HtpX [Candidatus Heimdallarchaeota archaeon LC_2]
MDSYTEIKLKRLLPVVIITTFDLLQLYLILKLDVTSNNVGVRGYSFSIQEGLALNTLTITYLLVSPIVISYFGIMNNTSRPGMVQVIGPKSLYQAVNTAFKVGEFRDIEKTNNNIQLYFEKISQGEPIGTIKNLTMIYSLGVLISKLIDESAVKSIKRVYMSDKDIPNAFTLRVIPIPFIGQDWIIINRNLVEVLNNNEIRAVTAHEIGHAARYDSWLNVFISVPKWIIIFGWSIVFFKMMLIIFEEGLAGFSLYRVVTVFLFFVIIRLSLNIIQYLTDIFRRNSELLADHYAAQLVGSDILVNGLVKIARRADVINSIHTDLEFLIKQSSSIPPNAYLMRTLNALSPSELSIENVREDIIKNYVTFKLKDTFRALRIQITDDNLNILIEQSCSRLNDILVEEKSKTLKSKPFSIEHWKEIDLDDNQYLSKEEILLFAEKLKESEFQNYNREGLAKMGMILESPSHPHINKRIIFINDSIISKELNNK